ncbi:MAG: NAD+ synthase [Pseudomonadota bacterium]|nr:NAD+ synthase [Pseudomonadota bacterium]
MSSASLTIVMAQINPLVGDIPGNTQLVLQHAEAAHREHRADVVVFPELVLTAYPPEDLLLRPSLDLRIARALDTLCAAQLPLYMVVGYPGRENGHLYNMLAVIHEGRIVGTYRKQCLPNYQVFDEKRYFREGNAPLVLDLKGVPVGFTICEDLWEAEPMLRARAAGARLMININGSPYHGNKAHERVTLLQQRVREGGMPLLYVNQVGGQDELVFDGASVALDSDGTVQVQAAQYEEQVLPVVVQTAPEVRVLPGHKSTWAKGEAELYGALVLGLREYVNKNRFKGVVMGLSGGIDSALTLALAVDALGKERVQAVMMPFTYTAQMSVEDAEAEARALGVDFRIIPIGAMYDSFMNALQHEFEGHAADLTEQNLQARCRGVVLMAISNKKGLLVLTTGNKSEMAVGYSTLYGDMAGGFDVLKDVPKMQVYALSRYRNRLGDAPVIPQRVIDRPPSAELAPGQVDEDNLPPYPVLDRILELYVEQDLSCEAIVARGFERGVVEKVILMVDRNEYKRRQAPVGVRISKRGFGRDRRYPITAGWKPGD